MSTQTNRPRMIFEESSKLGAISISSPPEFKGTISAF